MRAASQFHGRRSPIRLAGWSGNPGQHVGEPGLRVDAVELGGLDQGVDRRRPLAAAVRAGEGPVAPADGHAAQRPLGRVVAQTDPPVAQEPGERLPVVECVGDRLADLRLARDPLLLLPQPGLELGQERRRPSLGTASRSSAA